MLSHSPLQTVFVSGWQRLRNHSELWFVGVLALILPLLFLILTASALNTATNLTNTAEKSRIGSLHDAVSIVLEDPTARTLLPTVLHTLAENNPDIISLAVLREENNSLTLVADSVGSTSVPVLSASGIHRVALTQIGQTFIAGTAVSGVRHWQAFRAIELSSTERYYIYSEHTLEAIDTQITHQLQTTYTVLAFIVLFLLALGYHVSKQIDYRARYQASLATIQEHELFTSSVVHELRAPLTALRGYASLIEEAKDVPTPIRTYAEHIRRGTARLVTLISDYLEVTRIRSGLHSIATSPVVVSDVVARVVAELSPSAHEKHLTIGTVGTEQSITLISNEKYLIQICTNLLSNAIKYTPQGHIELSLVTDRNFVEIRIKDTGLGMSAEDQARLFAPFSRVGDAATQTITGSGLGMWITKLMVEQLGGTIGVESIKGVGTHVVIRFKKE